jgi:hypothetical protein
VRAVEHLTRHLIERYVHARIDQAQREKESLQSRLTLIVDDHVARLAPSVTDAYCGADRGRIL